MKINFIYNGIRLSDFGKIDKKVFKENIKYITKSISTEENIKLSYISLIFCNDEIIRDYNKKYLNHDYETDIITFHDTDEKSQTEGELLISLETVKYNSERFKTIYENEIYRVIIHGVLHLCGYKDKTSAEKSKIRKKEDFYLNRLKQKI